MDSAEKNSRRWIQAPLWLLDSVRPRVAAGESCVPLWLLTHDGRNNKRAFTGCAWCLSSLLVTLCALS